MKYDNINILMIGNKDSGKTTYMCSAYGLLSKGDSGCKLKSADNNREWLRTVFNDIKRGNYPNATNRRNMYDFELFYNKKKLFDINWIDYYGGVISEVSDEEFERDLNDVDGIMLFLDAVSLYNNNEKALRLRRLLAIIMNTFRNSDKIIPVEIILTKYDLLSENVNFTSLLFPLNQFIKNASKSNIVKVKVTPVSCTSNGFYNVTFPFIDIISKYVTWATEDALINSEYYFQQNRMYLNKWYFRDATKCADAYREYVLYNKIFRNPSADLSDFIKQYKIIFPNDPEVKNKYSSLGGCGLIIYIPCIFGLIYLCLMI